MTLARLFPFFAIGTIRSLTSATFTVSKMKSKHVRDYQEAITALNNLQTNAQYIKDVTQETKRVSNIKEVTKFLNRSGLSLELLDSLPVIHITGTNGKGSTCAYTESILRSHGYKTGFYCSPHLLDVRERIRINGRPITKDLFLKHFWKIYDLLDKTKDRPDDMPLYFRYLTILAFHIFLDERVDVAIIEVGIGGEHDCTNVIRKTAVAGITSLDLDHTVLLGNSLESIAWNKSGIMKEGAEVFCTFQPDNIINIFKQRSVERKCTLHVLRENRYDGKLDSTIPERCQRTNANLALAVSEAFIRKNANNNKKFSFELATKCIENTKWPGRYEIFPLKNIKFYLDGAHTLESIKICREWFMSKVEQRKRALIFNLTGDREPNLFFKELASCNFDVIIFSPNIGSLNGQDSIDNVDLVAPMQKQIKKCEENKLAWLSIDETAGDVKVVGSFAQAVQLLDDGQPCDVLVTGSIHLIGAALFILNPTLDGTLADD